MRAKTGGSGDVLVSFGNLGDQIRMMNVLSRFDLRGGMDVVCNAGTEAAFRLYPMTRSVSGYANQGAGALADAVPRMFASSAVYARALVPQPFVTQPLALASAKSLAAETLYCTPDESDRASGAIVLTRASWRSAYENFFSQVLNRQPLHARPQIDASLRYGTGAPIQPRIVVHFMTSAASRALRASLWIDLLDRLLPLGLHIAALGGKSEEAALRALCGDRPVEYWCGRPLDEVAKLLAGSRLFIGVDSSMMNLADAVGTPSVILYVRTTPHIHGPYYTQSRAVVPENNYAPVGVDPLISWKGAPPAGDIPVRKIVEAVNALLN